MRINSITFGNYNPATIINNPPHISNNPFYEYMRDNKLDFDSTNLKTFKAMVNNTQGEDDFMTGLLCATIGGIGVVGYVARKKVVNGWRRFSAGVKGAFHR